MTLEMFQDAPSAKPRNREGRDFYEGILYLRREGYRVVRLSSTQSSVDGHLLNHREITAFVQRVRKWKFDSGNPSIKSSP